MAEIMKKIVPGMGDEEAVPDASAAHPSLVEIFQNRNLLKREYEQAAAERDVLRADVEDLRKRHEELQRQLASLEVMLADPEKGQNAILYYRLKAVWDTCRQQIRGLAEDLSTRQAQFESTRHAEAYEQQRVSQLSGLQKLVEAADRDRQTLDSAIAEMEQELGKLKRFWHRGKRKRLQHEIDAVREKIPPIAARKLELVNRIEQVKKAPVPPYTGISIAARRGINLALLSLAQYMYLHFSEHNIAEMARSTGTKPVSDVHFGLTNDCLAIGARLWEVVVKLRNDTSRPDKLKHRGEYLRQKVSYAGDDATVPEEASLDYVLQSSADTPGMDMRANALPVNVLRLNYWDIQSLLLKPPEQVEQVPEVKVVGIGD